MSTIGIFIYSFQNNDLINQVKDIIEKSSPDNKLMISVVDQNSINHSKHFNISSKNIYINYKHVAWDSIKSPISYKKDFIDSTNTEYILICSDHITLSKQWDLDVINYLSNNKNIIISGNETKNLIIENGMINKKYDCGNTNYTKSNYIDRDFIFGKKEDICIIDLDTSLKYYGEEEMMFLSCFENNIDVFTSPSSLYFNKNIALSSYDYVPFSLMHNYNKIILKIKNSKLTNHILNTLSEIKFENNDVNYDPLKSPFNEVTGERYLNKTRSIS